MLLSRAVASAMPGLVAYRRSKFPIRHALTVSIVLSLLGLLGASLVSADDLTSASFIQRGGSFASASNPAMTSTAPSPEFAGAAGTLGDSMGSPPVGSAVDLTTVLPGFWVIVVGAFPTLDLDGDLAQFFLDDDDDGDGLDDDVETGTGVFVSASNTGTSPVDFDTDGDGLSDGAEVLAGSDPNDPGSPPPNVPFVGTTARGLLVVLLILTAMVFRLNRRRAV